jgi:hypothetical protein
MEETQNKISEVFKNHVFLFRNKKSKLTVILHFLTYFTLKKLIIAEKNLFIKI